MDLSQPMKDFATSLVAKATTTSSPRSSLLRNYSDVSLVDMGDDKCFTLTRALGCHVIYGWFHIIFCVFQSPQWKSSFKSQCLSSKIHCQLCCWRGQYPEIANSLDAMMCKPSLLCPQIKKIKLKCHFNKLGSSSFQCFSIIFCVFEWISCLPVYSIIMFHIII